MIDNFRGHYNECELMVKNYLKYIENSHILDIGSNVGFFSEAIVKNTNYKSIHLFEPSKEYYEYYYLMDKCSDIIYLIIVF